MPIDCDNTPLSENRGLFGNLARAADVLLDSGWSPIAWMTPYSGPGVSDLVYRASRELVPNLAVGDECNTCDLPNDSNAEYAPGPGASVSDNRVGRDARNENAGEVVLRDVT